MQRPFCFILSPLLSTWLASSDVCCICLFQALLAEQGSGTSTKGQTLTEQILGIMETILLEASSQPPEKYKVIYGKTFHAQYPLEKWHLGL